MFLMAGTDFVIESSHLLSPRLGPARFGLDSGFSFCHSPRASCPGEEDHSPGAFYAARSMRLRHLSSVAGFDARVPGAQKCGDVGTWMWLSLRVAFVEPGGFGSSWLPGLRYPAPRTHQARRLQPLWPGQSLWFFCGVPFQRPKQK